ncbi:glycosyltransferase family 2 protein [Paenibacillus xylaniclasticus]|uniref:glycosyltransferase family 2 protein n=1 Tax=Paenibacillus xylaniclasticus TaxID=588083 RepID=UPI00176EAB68|nr:MULTISPECIES: glycosyltransferase family 2 protein [Paenibacillus]GFN32783.1 glycosyl transferase [Paenibacillus curdlanolyticus]
MQQPYKHLINGDAVPASPTLSVCIVTYNSVSDIGECLDCVLAQAYPIKQIVVVDNASVDGTLDVLRPYEEHIDLVVSKVNTGFAGGQNIAIARTDSDYVLVLNPDVRLHPNYVGVLLAAMSNRPKIGSACGLLVRADDIGVVDSTGLAISRTRQVTDRGAGEAASNWQTAGEVFGVSGAAAIYSRAMIEDISVEGQFFDAAYFAYKEDVDVAWRARLLGWKAIYLPDAQAVHARGWKQGGRRSISSFVRQHSYQNQWFTLIKNERLNISSIIDWPLIMVKELLKLGYIILREPDLLVCWPRIVRSLPSMLRKRQNIQRRVRENNSLI